MAVGGTDRAGASWDGAPALPVIALSEGPALPQCHLDGVVAVEPAAGGVGRLPRLVAETGASRRAEFDRFGGRPSSTLVGRTNGALGTAEIWTARAVGGLTRSAVYASLAKTRYKASLTVVAFSQSLNRGRDTHWVQRTRELTASAGTRVTINDRAPTRDRWNLRIVEVR